MLTTQRCKETYKQTRVRSSAWSSSLLVLQLLSVLLLVISASERACVRACVRAREKQRSGLHYFADGWERSTTHSMARTRNESRVIVSYLVAYNMAQFLGWSYVFFKMLENIFETKDYRSTYAAVGGIVRKLQVIAVLEVLHAGLGLVRSDLATALMQWAGRTHVLLSIINRVPEVQTNISVFITIAAWATTEIVRYPQYGLSGLGVCPRWLTWLRYTMFIVLYPAGIYGEMLSMYLALDPIKYGDVSVKLFEYLPFSYYAFTIGLLVVYPLLFLVLYRHMFNQRRSRLAKREARDTRNRKER